MLWLAIALYWIESFYARMDGLQVLGLPAAAVAAMLPALFSEAHVLANAGSMPFPPAFPDGHAGLQPVHPRRAARPADGNRRKGPAPRPHLAAAGRPAALLTMEALLFRLIHVAFVLLTLTLISGVFFSETLFGKALTFNHKTLFAFLSWVIFAALLVGRHLRGWRGRLALRWTLAGFGTLLLAYVGSRFVLEVILGR
jgi:ABC-type uncharacterized transport system permease subunit